MKITKEKLQKIFPDYFKNFELPAGAREERILVYRACRTGKCDKLSFLPSFEEKNFCYYEGDDPSDPKIYSLSTYQKPKDVKRFVKTNSEFQVPYKIAIGTTEPKYGLVQPTKERKNENKKSSHVDWWLYKDANPHEAFKLIEDFEKYLADYKQKEGER